MNGEHFIQTVVISLSEQGWMLNVGSLLYGVGWMPSALLLVFHRRCCRGRRDGSDAPSKAVGYIDPSRAHCSRDVIALGAGRPESERGRTIV